MAKPRSSDTGDADPATRKTHAPATYFHVGVAAAAALAIAAIAQREYLLLALILAALAAVAAAGVAFPHLRLFVDFICRGDRTAKKVALTFDDGPDPQSTPRLLDLLREHKTPAAFFCVGAKVEAAPALAARITGEGHLLENHSYSHHLFLNLRLAGGLREELSRAQAAIEKITGVAPRYYRPPYGLTNSRTSAALRSLGLRAAGWSIRSLDTTIASPEKIVARIARKLTPGAIILLHDGDIPADKLIATTTLLLQSLRDHGYEIVRLDTLLG